MYAADLLSHVSIPQGTIKSVFAPVTSITLLAFQFHKVRLKAYHVRIAQCVIIVSIPQGTIKRQGTESSPQANMAFQFHKVRLKGLKYERCDC